MSYKFSKIDSNFMDLKTYYQERADALRTEAVALRRQARRFVVAELVSFFAAAACAVAYFLTDWGWPLIAAAVVATLAYLWTRSRDARSSARLEECEAWLRVYDGELVALDGDTVAVRVPVVPAIKDILVLFRETPVTETVPALTVTEQVAVLPPSDVVQVTVAEPEALAVTVPSEETDATEVLFEDQVTALFVASPGTIVVPNRYVSPTDRDNDVGDT